MTSKLNQFAVIYNKINWDQYKQEMASQILTGSPDLSNPNAVQFPTDPKNYPCLVASLLKPSDPTKANSFCQFEINCCFVYPEDAQRLVEAQAQLDNSIIIDDEFDDEFGDELDDELADYPEEDYNNYIPSQTGVMILALVNELVDIGALKRERFRKEVKHVADWLLQHREENLEDAELITVLQRLWDEKDAREL